MRRIPRASFRRMPWKNGGGETVELAAFPEGAPLDGFGWRLSMATVARPGPFSAFPGVDRTLAVLEGRLALDFEGRRRVVLHPGSPPLSFPADLAVAGEPLDGPVTDLNLMTRRGGFRHRLSRVEAGGPKRLPRQGDLMLVLEAGGDLMLVEEEDAVEAEASFVADLWRA